MNTKEPTFEQAINATILWCKAWETGELSDEVLADRVSELLASRNGTRGFFVISLSSDCPLMDRLPESLILRLRAAGDIVVDLSVRNLAMSSAMAIHHQRKSDSGKQAGSERITCRCIEILRVLEPNQVKKRLENLLMGLKGKGADVEFLEKWNYDEEQKMTIKANILSIAE